MLLARMRRPKIGSQLGNLLAKRFESAGQVFRNRAECKECGLKLRAAMFDQVELRGCHTTWEKATSVPWQYSFGVSTSYDLHTTTAGCGVNKLSGAETVFAQLFDQRRAPNAQQPSRAGNRAVSFLQGFADKPDFDC